MENVQKMNNKVTNEVLITTDYDKFSFLDGNRKLNLRNYYKLVNSMKEEQLQIPIIVNEDMCIIDGQHRFSASKELKLPVYYIVQKGYGLSQVKRANMVSSNWTKEDFLDSHIKDGAAGYEHFKEIIDTYNVNIIDLIKVFAFVQNKNQAITAKHFEEGSFVLDGEETVICMLDALEDFSYFKEYKSRQFFTAFMKLYFHTDYDHAKMKERLKTRKDRLVKKGSYAEYLEILTKEMYSYGAVKKPLFYDKGTKRFYN